MKFECEFYNEMWFLKGIMKMYIFHLKDEIKLS